MFYLIQIVIYTALFYAVYLLFLKNRASHQWNRFYLLQCAIAPLIIPLIKIPAFYNAIPVSSASAINTIMPAIAVFANKQVVIHSAYSRENAMLVAYLLVSISILFLTIYQFFLFGRFVKQHKYEVINSAKVLLDTNAGPGSFLNYIFLPGKEVNPIIFEHELAHIKLKHSRDILFIRLLQCLFWPNFMLYFILKELKIVHEFQADANAVKNDEYYMNELLNDIFSTRQFSLSHTFFYHPLKRRIIMLNKPVSRTKLRMAKSKAIIFAIFLIAGFIYLQSCSHADNKIISPQNDAVNNKPVYNMADTMPTTGFDLHEFLSKNLKYPEEARKKGTEGRVVVRFVVDENGNIVNPQILKSPDTLLSTEALRVMGEMPKWIPGKLNGKCVSVKFTLPLMFMLGSKSSGDSPNQFSKDLSKQENDTLANLIGKAANDKNSLTEQENYTLVRLVNKMKK